MGPYFPSSLDLSQIDDSDMMHPTGLDMVIHSPFTDQLPNETEATSRPVATERTTQLLFQFSMMEKSARGYPYSVLDADHGSMYHAGGISGTELDVYPQVPLKERYSSPSGPCGGDLSSNTESDRSPSPRLAWRTLECLPYRTGHPHYWLTVYDQYGPDESSVALKEVQHYPDLHADEIDVIPEFEVEPETLGQKAVSHIYQPSFSYHNEAEAAANPDKDADAQADEAPSDETADSDATYASTAMQRKGVTSLSRRQQAMRNTPNRVRKRGLRRNTTSKTSPKFRSKDGGASRQFVCSFHHYGCPSTFASKNEWKRHVTSQHLQLGFYRCDLEPCKIPPPDDGSPNSHGNRQPNDFNRKDLFTQHLRRMHSPWPARYEPKPQETSNFENSLEAVRQRCWQTQRQPPPRSRCGFCGRIFEGPHSWEERMEHVGKHYEQRDVQPEAEDLDLREWAIQEGIICPDGARGLILSSMARMDRRDG